jgi:subtilisin family serine protease
MWQRGRRLPIVGTIVIGVSSVTCGGGESTTAPPTPSAITASSQTTQTAVVGTPVGVPPSVRVTAAGGGPFAGVSVAFSVASGGGSLEGAQQVTDANGVATVTRWTLGIRAGDNTVTARVGALAPVVFNAAGTPDRAATVKLSSDSVHFDAIGDIIRLTAVVSDRHANTLTDPQIQWTATDPSVVSIDAQGVVTSRSRGQTSITAVSDTARVSAKSVVAPKSSGVVIAPDAGTINAIGDTLRLAVTARDRNGNVLTDAQVSWSSLDPTVAGVGAPGEVVSKATGNARIVAASDAVADTVSVLVRQVVATVAVGPTDQTLAAGSTLQLTASARDSNDVAIADAVFAWTSSDPEAVEVSTMGLARGRKARSSAITAATAGKSASTVITVVPGPAHSLSKAAGDAQTGLAGVELAQPISVRIVDAFENAITGATVEWTVSSGSGSVNSANTTTDGGGLASVRWTLGPTKGSDTARASSGALLGSPGVFVATATPNGRITGQVSTASSLQSRSRTIALGAASHGRPLNARETPATTSVGAKKRADLLAGTPATVLKMQTRWQPTAAHRVPGSLIVRFRAQALGVTDVRWRSLRNWASAQALAKEMRVRLETSARVARFDIAGTSPAILAARVRAEPERVAAIQAELEKNPAVLSVEPEVLSFGLGLAGRAARIAEVPLAPNDPLYNPQAWHYAAIDLPEAWAITTGSRSVLVAVVDDGIRFDHPALAANLTSDGYDFVSSGLADVCGVLRDNAGDGNGYDPDPTTPARYDCRTGGLTTLGGHGVHVAGTIGAMGNDAVGTVGVNWFVRIRPVRVLGVGGSGSNYDIAQGILYAAGLPADNGAGGQVQAASGARVINLSLGGPVDSQVLREAVQAASAAGALLVVSAGNDAVSNPKYPAAYPEVVAVSAVGPDLQLASYSNFGSTVDIAAPGGDFGDGDASYGVASTMWNFAAGQPAYGYNQGTSMAAPHVTGVVALVLAADPSLSAAQLRDRLTTFAVDLGAPGRDDLYGAGLLNARNSLTRTLAPGRALHAVLYDAQTGARLRSARVAADATYTFAALDDGRYLIFAGEDEDGDGLTGVPGRRWGTYGNATTRPSEVTVAGAGSYPASVSVGWPSETEPNEGSVNAGRLVLGGYVHAQIATGADADWFSFTVPTGHYVLETSAWDGACGYALETDTVIELTTADGFLVTFNDDVSPQDFCSRITRPLSGGTYFVKVTGFDSGRYRLALRALPAP